MKPGGWIFLILSWGAILALCGYCFAQIFGGKKEHLVSPIEIEMELEDDSKPKGV